MKPTTPSEGEVNAYVEKQNGGSAFRLLVRACACVRLSVRGPLTHKTGKMKKCS